MDFVRVWGNIFLIVYFETRVLVANIKIINPLGKPFRHILYMPLNTLMPPTFPSNRLCLRGLYAITPDTVDTDKLCSQVEQVLSGGATILQYRNKLTNTALAYEQASILRTLTRRFNVIFIVNDNIELALAVDADGVHLGKADLDKQAVAVIRRQYVPANREQPFLIGISCYDDLHQATNAAHWGADYVAFGSFFYSTTKPHAVRPPITLITQAKQLLSIPVVAIGGVTIENASQLINAGADAVAVVSDLFSATDIYTRSITFSRLFKVHQHELQ